ncbi:hypothetical protein HLH10_15710 [Acinetobacter sp. ANC 4277]|uniref:hypothetical protein n=1 Tax=Acinetobacter terrae TaxID=2731247 RepID=UPI00149071DC|nr:hypothetical protein [Acinetobacter terrae]NNG77674.1 hypothetical protein [Acinetobacter terrae]
MFQRSEPLWLESLKDHTTAKIIIGPCDHLQAAMNTTDGNSSLPPLTNIAL